MIHIDDIAKKWGEHAHVLVRPANGDWEGITDHWSDRGDTGFRPAKITGFVEGHESYGTQNDPRRIWLIGSAGSYPHDKFEIGAVIDTDLAVEMTPTP